MVRWCHGCRRDWARDPLGGRALVKRHAAIARGHVRSAPNSDQRADNRGRSELCPEAVIVGPGTNLKVDNGRRGLGLPPCRGRRAYEPAERPIEGRFGFISDPSRDLANAEGGFSQHVSR